MKAPYRYRYVRCGVFYCNIYIVIEDDCPSFSLRVVPFPSQKLQGFGWFYQKSFAKFSEKDENIEVLQIIVENAEFHLYNYNHDALCAQMHFEKYTKTYCFASVGMGF